MWLNVLSVKNKSATVLWIKECYGISLLGATVLSGGQKEQHPLTPILCSSHPNSLNTQKQKNPSGNFWQIWRNSFRHSWDITLTRMGQTIWKHNVSRCSHHQHRCMKVTIIIKHSFLWLTAVSTINIRLCLCVFLNDHIIIILAYIGCIICMIWFDK